MSSGKPDWYTSAVLTGKYGIQFLPVAVDGDGNIKAVLQGSSLITGDVNATDLNTLKQIQGIEGATYRTIAVDSLGQLIAVIKSAAGNNVVVDASGFLSSILKGTYSTPGDKNIAVDADGRLMAMVKALYGSTVKDVQSDTNGNLTLNLKAQDLAEIINRPKYGAMQHSEGGVTIGTGQEVTILQISGKGMTYSGYIYLYTSTEAYMSTPILYIDGTGSGQFRLDERLERFQAEENSDPFRIAIYNTVNNKFSVALKRGITFDTSLQISVINSSGTQNLSCLYSFQFALI